MYRMDHMIRIGETVLPVLTSVKIEKDVTKLTDRATIVCPAVAHGRNLAYVKQIAKWQSVRIELGYDGKLREEFSGYVRSVSLDGGELTIECEDALLLFQRVDIPNGEMKDAPLKNVLEYVVGKVNDLIRSEGLGEPLAIDCLYSYTYGKLTFHNSTAYEAMERIQKDGSPNIYIRGNVLHIVPQYTHSDGETRYSMQRNICKEGTSLKWKNEDDRPLYVEVTGQNTNGDKAEASKGRKGGNELSINMGNCIKDTASLQAIADNLYNSKSYTGYDGSFKTWLIPYCDAGYIVELSDNKKSVNPGRYYVQSVKVEYSRSGGSRVIGIGAAVTGF
jgi:hypothetical protein